MSHFLTAKVKVTNKDMAHSVAGAMGWMWKQHEHYKSPYGQSRDNVEVYKKGQQDKMLLEQDGTVTADPYYMGHDYEKFLQQYTEQSVIATTAMDGGMLANRTVNADGDVVLQIQFM